MKKENISHIEIEKPIETLGWDEKTAFRVLNNAQIYFDKEKKLGELKKLPQKITEIPDSLFNNNKNELRPFRKQEMVFIPSKDEKGRPARIFAVGDIHSDSTGVKRIISEFEKALKRNENAYLVSLGDYVDRPKQDAARFEESEQLDCFHRILREKLSYPDRVIALAGNHETNDVNSRYGFLKELTDISKDFVQTWKTYNNVFSKLPRMAMLSDSDSSKCHIFAHAGIPSKPVKNLDQLVAVSNQDGIIWSDPGPDEDKLLSWDPNRYNKDGFRLNRNRLRVKSEQEQHYIDQGYVQYNRKALDNFLDGIGSRGILIRGHETPESGLEKNLSGKAITIFSADRYGLNKMKGKYLDYVSETNEFNYNNLDQEAKRALTKHVVEKEIKRLREKNETMLTSLKQVEAQLKKERILRKRTKSGSIEEKKYLFMIFEHRRKAVEIQDQIIVNKINILKNKLKLPDKVLKEKSQIDSDMNILRSKRVELSKQLKSYLSEEAKFRK